MRIDSITVERDDGRSLVLGPSSRWRVAWEGLDGFDGLDREISVRDYAQYDGARATGARVPAKDRTISAIGLGDPSSLRAEAEAFFVAGRSYTVHVEAGGRRRMSRAEHYGLHLATDNATGHQLLEWTFMSLDPYWLGEDERGYDVAEAVGGFGFPFMSLAEPWELPAQLADAEEDEGQVDYLIGGFVVGVLSHRIEMENEGGATAYPRFVISATGEVVRPSVAVYDSSGAEVCRFGVAVTLNAGDELVIDFSARPTTIELNGENVSNMALPGSTLATGIEPGTFELGWSAESGDAAMSVKPYIRDRFVTI